MTMTRAGNQAFRRKIRRHYATRGRNLPWRHVRDPYRILVSEVMLQQTQVARVIAYYKSFLREFPTIKALASAPLPDVLRAWRGLGYNRRALMLKRAAEHSVLKYDGKLPQDVRLLDDLPGIGINTAGAITAFAFNTPSVFIETNIRRVFIHFFFPGGNKVYDRHILKLVEETMDRRNPREWYYALMDYGAYLGREMKENPNRRSHSYARQSRFEGSDRQIRAGIVKLLLLKHMLTYGQILKTFAEPEERIVKILSALEKEGLILKSKASYRIGV